MAYALLNLILRIWSARTGINGLLHHFNMCLRPFFEPSSVLRPSLKQYIVHKPASHCTGCQVIRHYCVYSVMNLGSVTTSTKLGPWFKSGVSFTKDNTQGTAKCIVRWGWSQLVSLLNLSSSRKHSHNSTSVDPLKPGWKNNRPMFRVRCTIYVTELVNLQCSQARGKKFRLGVTIIIAPVESVIREIHLGIIEWILLEGWEGRVRPIIIVVGSTFLRSVIIWITSTRCW